MGLVVRESGQCLMSLAHHMHLSSCSPVPRYARVNTLLATVDDVIQQLTTEGWERVKYPPTLTYDGFISQVKVSSVWVVLLVLR